MNKRRLAMLVAELLGTFVLAIVVLSINRYGLPIFTAAAAGVVMATMMATLGNWSGGYFNPAITVGLAAIRKISPLKALAFVAAQGVGAVLAWQLYEWFADRELALQTTEFDWRVFFAELIGTAIFGFAVAAVIYRKYDKQFAVTTVGSGFFIGASVSSLVSLAGIINPAVAIALGFRPENTGYLAYLLGPVLGALIGMLLYKYAFADDEVAAKVVASARTTAATPTTKSVTASKSTKKKPAPKKASTTKKRTTKR